MTSTSDNRPEAKRSGLGPQTAGKLLSKAVRQAFSRQGFAEPGILLRWPEIVGDTLCRFTLPERLSFPQGERGRGTLHLRVDGQFALEVQHLEPLIIERINGFFGYGAVARIAILQAPIPEQPGAEKRPRRPKSAKTAPAPSPSPDESLEEALARLSAHIGE